MTKILFAAALVAAALSAQAQTIEVYTDCETPQTVTITQTDAYGNTTQKPIMLGSYCKGQEMPKNTLETGNYLVTMNNDHDNMAFYYELRNDKGQKLQHGPVTNRIWLPIGEKQRLIITAAKKLTVYATDISK